MYQRYIEKEKGNKKIKNSAYPAKLILKRK